MVAISAQAKHHVNIKKYLRKLPLLDFTSNLYSDTDLEDTYIICAQHLVSTTYSLFHTLIKLGLKANNLSAIGKCYSTDPQAYEEMKKIGIDVCPSSLVFDSHSSFDADYRRNIKNFILQRIVKLKSSKFQKIIVLDDGGELIKALDELLGKTNCPIVGIEQTSSGFQKLKNKKIKFPIINVARSPAKLNYESPIIARLVVDTLVRRINHLPIQPREVLIIGMGPIGSQIQDALSRKYHISTYDTDISKSSIRPEDFEASLKKFDLIIGCTGASILRPEQYKFFKKNVILVSASSSDREFNAVHLRNKLLPVKNCHDDLDIDGIFLINCGFPINFAAEFREIDSDELQLTRSLLLTAILQASHHSDYRTKGFISLDMEHQRDIVQKYLSMFTYRKIDKREKLAV